MLVVITTSYLGWLTVHEGLEGSTVRDTIRQYKTRYRNTAIYTIQPYTTLGITPLDEGSAPSQRPLPDNTQHSQETGFNASAGFEPAIPVSFRPQSLALQCSATGIGWLIGYGSYFGGCLVGLVDLVKCLLIWPANLFDIGCDAVQFGRLFENPFIVSPYPELSLIFVSFTLFVSSLRF